MNLPLVAADVRRRIFLVCDHFRLLTSAATVHGAQGAIKVRGCLSMKDIVAQASRLFESKRTGETPVPLPARSGRA